MSFDLQKREISKMKKHLIDAQRSLDSAKIMLKASDSEFSTCKMDRVVKDVDVKCAVVRKMLKNTKISTTTKKAQKVQVTQPKLMIRKGNNEMTRIGRSSSEIEKPNNIKETGKSKIPVIKKKSLMSKKNTSSEENATKLLNRWKTFIKLPGRR